MKPEELVRILIESWGANLQSAVLYGSAVTGDFVEKRSDYNLLLVADRLDWDALQQLSGPVRRWVKAGNPPPLCFTALRLAQATDVFPIELLDIQENHRLLHGRDIVRDLVISKDNLRHQLEYELRSRLLLLRERILLAGDDAARLTELMTDSLSTFLILFRGALRLWEDRTPAQKLEALEALSRRLSFSTEPFETVHSLRTGRRTRREVDPVALCREYLTEIEKVMDGVDRYLHRASNPSPL